MTTQWLGTNTLANIQAALLTLAGNLADGERKSIEFGISTASGYFGATNYIGSIERISSSRLCVHVMCAMFTSQMIIGNYKDGTWYWDEVAKASQIGGLRMVQLTKSMTSGYFAIAPAEIPAGKKLIIQKVYGTGNNYSDYTFSVQANASGSSSSYYIYVRQNGAVPQDNDITVNILYMD